MAPNAYRELYYGSFHPYNHSFLTFPFLRHWHSVGEWGIVLGGTSGTRSRSPLWKRALFVLGGTGRITSVDTEGRTYISDIKGPRNGSEPDIFT